MELKELVMGENDSSITKSLYRPSKRIRPVGLAIKSKVDQILIRPRDELRAPVLTGFPT